MSGFCVFGMTEVLAKRLARDAAERHHFSRDELNAMTPAKWEAWIATKAEEILEHGNVRQVSPTFDAPQFANEWIALAKRTARAKRCRIMVRGNKVDSTGMVVLNKRGLPVMTWVAYQAPAIRKAA
jgi:hypothetical protein